MVDPDELASTDALMDLGDACRSLGIPVDERERRVDGVALQLDIVVRSHPNPSDIHQLVSEHDQALLVADRISAPGREALRAAGWSFLDRRGHVRIWQPGLRIDSPYLATRDDLDARVRNPWTQVGLEVALAAIIHSSEPVSARAIAARIGRSAGSVHELLGRFMDEGLVGNRTRRALLPDFFFELVARWPDNDWFGVPVSLADAAERFGADHFLRIDERAATFGGARIAAAAALTPRAYVDAPSVLRRLRGLRDADQPVRLFVRLQPTRWCPELDAAQVPDELPYRIAHPVLAAVRLAKDPARGREIVEHWGIIPGVTS